MTNGSITQPKSEKTTDKLKSSHLDALHVNWSPDESRGQISQKRPERSKEVRVLSQMRSVEARRHDSQSLMSLHNTKTNNTPLG